MMVKKINRIWWQITGAILFNFPFLEPLTFAWLPVPVLNCYSCPIAQGACPIGTFQHFLIIGAIPLFVMGVIGFFGLLVGRFYCSHLCPFGFFQELLGRITRHKKQIPHFLEYGKYASLVLLVIILPPIVSEPFFCTLCPAGTIEAGFPIVIGAWIDVHIRSGDIVNSNAGILGMVGWWFWFKASLLGLVIALAVFTKRPFCRTACPLGATLALFNRISIFVHPPVDKTKDTSPHYFLKNCPVGITHPDKVDSGSCIKCRECYPQPMNNT